MFISLIFAVLAIALALLILAASLMLFTTEQQTKTVIQRLGKFDRIAEPGLSIKWPFIENIAGRVNLRIKQLDVKVETKTQDNVFVLVIVSVQYFVDPERVYEAFYKLVRPEAQITAFVFDVVRARVPLLTLDDLFEKKDNIAIAVKEELSHVMHDFGYDILKALITDIEPDTHVKKAMNEINAAQRMRLAAVEKGEADKILRVKAAEAEAESNALHGKGIADQRRAIVEGLSESVSEFQAHVPGSSPHDVMQIVLMTQYFDTLKDLSAHSKTNTILVPHSPSHLNDLTEQMRSAFITAQAANSNLEEHTPQPTHIKKRSEK
ncbi:MAG: Band 7 protein [candidate division TM6 bacterium GW2011_GWF2_43_17]|nr:MAG: Band 7 protein [candidate division TM6 bacterium GW2011_GWF2_43_17]